MTRKVATVSDFRFRHDILGNGWVVLVARDGRVHIWGQAYGTETGWVFLDPGLVREALNNIRAGGELPLAIAVTRSRE